VNDKKAAENAESPEESRLTDEAAAARERARERAADEHFPRKSATSGSGSNQ
jgi:hypothetical protein